MVPGPQAWEEAGRGVWWGKKAETLSRARRMVHVPAAGLRARVRTHARMHVRACVRECVNACVRAYVRSYAEEDGGGAAGDNDGDKARPADGRSERKKRGGRREAAVKE